MCDYPEVVVLAHDIGDKLALATERAVDDWNAAAGKTVLVHMGRGLFESNAPRPRHSLIYVLQHPKMSDIGGTTLQHLDKGCAVGTTIRIFVSPDDHVKTLEYRIKHELGHALGIPHGYWGVMAPVAPNWLPDYILTGGEIDGTDKGILRRYYP